MGESDEFLRAQKSVIDKWKNACPKVSIFGNIVSKRPDYISVLSKEREDVIWTFLNGVRNKIADASGDMGYSVRVAIGDDEQGYGEACSARDDFPKNPELMYELINNRMDLTVKNAVRSYLGFIKDGMVEERDLFSKFSDETAEVFLDEDEDRLFVGEDIRRAVLKFNREAYQKNIVKESDARISTHFIRKRFADSDGRKIREGSQMGNIQLAGSFDHKNGQCLRHLEDLSFTGDIDTSKLYGLMDNFYSSVEQLKKAVTPISGYYPVILSGRAASTMIHEALGGHLLSGKLIKEGVSSVFKDKIGSPVLPNFLSVVDDPRMEGAIGSYLFDDEGIASKKTVLIDKGVLMNYLLDRRSAEYFGMNSNGHSRIEWIKTTDPEGKTMLYPEPRVSNLNTSSERCVPNGELEDIARKYCRDSGGECVLYVDSVKGSVNPFTGEFKMIPSGRNYKIFPDGRREPVNNFVLIANAYEVFCQIGATGDKYEVTNASCGSFSGRTATQNSAPRFFIPRVNIQAVYNVNPKKSLL